MSLMIPPHFGVVGYKNSGKTTLINNLITYFQTLGLQVAVIKHAHHGFDIDKPETDSYQFRENGAQQIVVSSDLRTAIIKEHSLTNIPTLDQLLTCIDPNIDVVLIEGFKRDDHFKLLLADTKDIYSNRLIQSLTNIAAISSDGDISYSSFSVPYFDRNDIEAIGNFILNLLRVGY